MRTWWINTGRRVARELAKEIALTVVLPALLRAADSLRHRLDGRPHGQ